MNYFFSYLGNFLNIKPNFFLKYGSVYSPYESKEGVKTLNGHSLDFNMFLKTKEKIFKYTLYRLTNTFIIRIV